jgi:hypothetical protein
LLPEHEILQNEIPAAAEEANHYSDPEEKQAQHSTELYQNLGSGYCRKLLIRWPDRILARHREQNGNSGQAGNHEEYASYDMQPLPRLRGLRLLIPSSRQKKSQIERSFAAALFFQMPRARLQ